MANVGLGRPIRTRDCEEFQAREEHLSVNRWVHKIPPDTFLSGLSVSRFRLDLWLFRLSIPTFIF